MHEQRVARAYFKEILAGFAVYAILLVASILFGRPMQDGVLRTAILLLPMLGFGLVIRAVARHIGRIDEYQRRQVLETLGLAFGITAAVALSYGFLETAGFPHLSMFAVFMVMAGSCAAITLVRCRLRR
jgi:hypothetical protein